MSLGGTSRSQSPLLASPAPIPTVATGGRGQAASLAGNDEGAKAFIPIAVLVLVGAWILWAVIEEHKKISSVLQPKNLKLNIWNLFKVGLMAVIFVTVARIALAKLQLVLGSALQKWPLTPLMWVYDINGAFLRMVG
jgi:hypothetical protein